MSISDMPVIISLGEEQWGLKTYCHYVTKLELHSVAEQRAVCRLNE